MGEFYARVVLYDLNCDHPEHDRVAWAQLRCSDPNGSEWRTDDHRTVASARAEARRGGWRIKPDGTAICPDCAERPAA